MKFLIVILIMIISISAHGKALQTSYYTSESLTPKTSEQIPTILKSFALEHPTKNIIFYVHGRSRTLEKEFNIINQMEKIYNVKVLMLHWDSWHTQITRPVGNAKQASLSLSNTLNQIDQLKKEEPILFSKQKIFLLCHSMGNIIFKYYIEKYKNISLDNNLFNAIIINGSDVPFTGHQKWISHIHFSKNIYITMNKNDGVLLASRTSDFAYLNLLHFSDDRLGLAYGIDNLLLLSKKLSPNAIYFDLSDISGMTHNHYLNEQPDVRELFHYMFQEGPYILPGNYKQQNNYYKFF